MKLEEIAEVSIGILTNREARAEGDYKYKLFNIKEYDQKEEYTTYKFTNDFSSKLTKKGDLLFRMVWPNRIIYVDDNLENLLVSSQMCIIRCDTKKINPIFLKWYLESDVAKEKMKEDLTGSAIQKISVSALRKIEIPNINIDKQEEIKDLITLWENEKDIMSRIKENKDILYTSLIYDILENEGE